MRLSTAQPLSFTSACLSFELLAGGDADHLLDEIDAGDQLGDGVLDLQARVHLQEEEGAVLAGHELHRAGAVVADGPASATACSPMALRVLASSSGEGASSITF